MRKSIYKTEARSAIIAAVVALVVAAPLSNAAHEGVSSAVKIVKGKQGKTGKRGPRGFRGPTGATGAVGPQGQRGPAGATVLPPRTAIIPVGETRTVGAPCPNHDAEYGAYLVTNSPGTPTVVKQGVSADATYFYAVLRNDDTAPAFVDSVVVCESD